MTNNSQKNVNLNEVNSTSQISREKYVKLLEKLAERYYSQFISKIGSNRIYLAFSYTEEEIFDDIMSMNIAELMAATEKYGRPDESAVAKRTFYKLAITGDFYNKFELFIQRCVDDLTAVTQGIPELNSDYRKCAESNEVKLVLYRLELFLASFEKYKFPFKKKLKEYGFTPENKKLVSDYHLKFGKKICE